MSAYLLAGAKALTIACDVVSLIDAIDALDRCQARDMDGKAETASVVNRLALLAFSGIEAGMLAAGAKSDSLNVLKKIEYIPRSLQLFIQSKIELGHFANNPTFENFLKFLTKGAIIPTTDMLRVSREMLYYQWQSSLEKSLGDPSQKDVSGDEHDDMGSPIDPVECQENYERARRDVLVTTAARTLAVAASSSDMLMGVYERLGNYLQRAQAQMQMDAAPFEPINPHQDFVDDVDWTNLMALDVIPEPLEADPVFSRYICAITLSPIRHPVRDPNGRTLYERSAILLWLRRAGTSPVTRRPWDIRNVHEDVGIALIINTRMRQHQENYVRYRQLQRAV